MKKAILFFAIFTLYINCQPELKKTSSLVDYIPANSAFIFKINDLQGFKLNLKNNTFLKKIKNTSISQDLENFISQIQYLNTEETILLCIEEVGIDNFEYLLITQNNTSLFDTKDIGDKKIESFEYENRSLEKIDLNGIISYTTQLDNIILNASSQLLIENSIRRYEAKKEESDPLLLKIYETASDNSTASVFLNHNIGERFFNYLFPDVNLKGFQKFSDWTCLDLYIDQNTITMNGITISENTNTNIIPLFYENEPDANSMAEICPVNSDGFISYSYADWESLKQKLSLYNNKTDTKKKETTLFDATNEIGIIYGNEGQSVALHYTNIEAAKIELESEKSLISTFREVSIYEFSDFKLLVSELSPLIKNAAANFYTIIDEFLIFSNDVKNLHTIISNYQNKSTLAYADSYKQIMDDLNESASVLLVSNNETFKKAVSDQIKKPYQKDLNNISFKGYPHFVIQLVADNGFAHLNASLKEIKKQGKSGTVSQIANITIDADIATKPQFVINHRTNQKEIVVQDTQNYLYLISNKGKVLWKKQLKERIQGDIQQVDLYKNGRLQLAFATAKEFHIIDRNGNEVAPFPLKFDENITQPLAVFDYDKNKNYRFVLTFGKSLKMYDSKGSVVTGFKFKKTKSPILNSPKHFRQNSKDYIAIQEENGKLHLLDRRGKERIKTDQTLDFSGNELFLYKNKFSTTTNNGSLIQIDEKGSLNEVTLNLEENHKIDATAKTLASISDNILSIKSNKKELDFGFYSQPKIFYINDKIYVSITDTQANKLYLFDSNAIAIPNFPVYGISAIDMADIDNDNHLEIVVQGEKSSILIYKIN